ncbi:MAG: hypothetical protein Q9218_005670, partial [Villophora microphyllina]
MHRHNSDGESYQLLPENEMQRQQLLRLLLQRENSKKPSPEAGQSTFHIDLPDSIRRTETHLTTPRSIYASRENSDSHLSHSFTLPPLSPFSSMRAPSPYQSIPTQNQLHSNPSTPPIPSRQPHTPPLQSHSRQASTTRMQRNFSESSRAPPYSALSNHGSIRFPTEKEQQTMTNTLNGDIHPLERERERQDRDGEREDWERDRPQYRVIESSPVQDLSKLMDPARRGEKGMLERQRSTSRESRRAEIELERGRVGGGG